jgi:hypothetical protein
VHDIVATKYGKIMSVGIVSRVDAICSAIYLLSKKPVKMGSINP